MGLMFYKLKLRYSIWRRDPVAKIGKTTTNKESEN